MTKAVQSRSGYSSCSWGSKVKDQKLKVVAASFSEWEANVQTSRGVRGGRTAGGKGAGPLETSREVMEVQMERMRDGRDCLP